MLALKDRKAAARDISQAAGDVATAPTFNASIGPETRASGVGKKARGSLRPSSPSTWELAQPKLAGYAGEESLLSAALNTLQIQTLKYLLLHR